MLPELINHSPDLEKLRNDGYTVETHNNCVVVRDVPYLDESMKVIEDGVLVCAYEQIRPLTDHTFYFSGKPHKADGKALHVASEATQEWNGFNVSTQLSFKKVVDDKPSNYNDYHEKVTYYINAIMSQARSINEFVNAQKHRVIDTSEQNDTPFNYLDMNSSRAGIFNISEKLRGQKIAIIGVGGTGSYILDLVSKTPVAEIHIFDNDVFHSHNAFRTPGAAPKGVLESPPKKVSYFAEIYKRMHKGVTPHEYDMLDDTINELEELNFVFLCIDNAPTKKVIIGKLVELKIPFVDCGIDVQEVDNALNGTIRVTTVTPSKYDHIENRISYSAGNNGDYQSNIQIAELNALNAALAVIKWKRFFGFYHDHESEHHTTYMFNASSLNNDEKINS
ncbi:MAG: ThiF family adenylyltransferase [Minisyncoccia bacterium]